MDFAKHIRPLSGEKDWPLWKRKIRDLLDYHEGALDAIDGKLRKPEDLEQTATNVEIKRYKEKFDFYRKANSYAKSMVTSSITDAVYQKVMDKETAHDTWEALKQLFEATSKDQLFKICTDFFAFTWSSDEDISTHTAKIRSLWNELNNGLKDRGENSLPDLMLICKILHILPSKFETFKSSWMLLTKDENKTFEELTVQLCMFERNFTKTSENIVQEALVTKTDSQKYESKRKVVYKKSKKNDNCNYCHIKGHWIKDCRRWIADGRPTRNKPTGNSQDRSPTASVALMSISEDLYTAETNSTIWWIDNGATKHVTNNLNLFTAFKAFTSPCTIRSAGKETLSATGKGTIRVLSTVNNRSIEIKLEDVWYVPNISRNLFSVLAAQDRNLNSEFRSSTTKCWFKVNGQVLLCGIREVGGTLYKALIKPILSEHKDEINTTTSNSSLLQLYHERWGHQDKQHIKLKLKRELGINVQLDKELCEPCVYGKAHRLPFGNRTKATKPGELVTTDVCGPFDESFQKKRYLVMFKDSYTKFRYGYLIQKKSEVKNVLKYMLKSAKTLGHSIKQLLSDNGGEFDNEEVREILHTEGIMQRLTAPYTPEQNGGSEREMRTVVEMARTFKYSNSEVDFPRAIWAELVNTAIYTLNRTGKSSVEGASPTELWFGKKPRIKQLRIIGSTCYAHVPKEKRRKMDKKAIKGYLVGYDGDERYRIWIKEEHKVILSRDVTFLEKSNDCEENNQSTKKFNEEQNRNEKECEENDPPSSQEDERSEEDEISEEDETSQEDETNRLISNYSLRNSSLLKKPNYFGECIMEAENLTNEINNRETYKEAISSKQSNKWREATKPRISPLHHTNQAFLHSRKGNQRRNSSSTNPHYRTSCRYHDKAANKDTSANPLQSNGIITVIY